MASKKKTPEPEAPKPPETVWDCNAGKHVPNVEPVVKWEPQPVRVLVRKKPPKK